MFILYTGSFQNADNNVRYLNLFEVFLDYNYFSNVFAITVEMNNNLYQCVKYRYLMNIYFIKLKVPVFGNFMVSSF